ncbi:hypothetical protein Tco_0747150 [Tanacetum coccineum]
MINQSIQDSKSYKTYLTFSTREATLKKVGKFKKIDSPSKKQTLVLEEEPAKKPKRDKHPEPKKSAPAKKDISSKKPSRNKRETHSQQASGSSDGVGSQPKGESGDDDDSNEDDSNDDDFSDDDGNDDDSDDDGGDNNNDDERTESDEDKNPNLNQNDDDHEEEKGVRMKRLMLFMYDVIKEITYDQVEVHTHVLLTTVHESTEQDDSYHCISVALGFSDKDLFESYGKAYSLKRDREDKDKDEDPPARSDQRIEDLVSIVMEVLDELYIFSDGTLTSVRSVLHDIASNMRMDYLPK